MKDKHVSIPMTILSLAIGIIVIFPIIWLVLSSFKPSGELFTYPLHMFPSAPTTEHYKSVLDGGFIGYVKNSLFLAVVGTLITLLISAMCGYALAIYRFEIKYVNLVFGVFLLGTLIPGETLTVPQFSVISAMACTTTSGASSCLLSPLRPVSSCTASTICRCRCLWSRPRVSTVPASGRSSPTSCCLWAPTSPSR